MQLIRCGFESQYMHRELWVTWLSRTCMFSDAIETLRNADAVCFDVDSTVIMDEGIDELADFCGAGKAVAEWTAK